MDSPQGVAWIVQTFEAGGPVMWPLLVLSLVSVTMTIERAVFWLRQRRGMTGGRVTRLAEALRGGDSAQVRQLADDGVIADRVARQLVEHGASEASAVELTERYRPAIERFAASMATIITASPLLGILGTVLGIIQSFDLLGQSQGSGDIAPVAAGIAEALITTAFGLIVALVTLFPHMVFRAQAERCLALIERLSAAALSGK
ncbi:MAG: MotA/TolQ/ExbB proton channel family protein [Phycisphaerales bacterium]|nr:MotA/TolQ/ExbB proton channel family protein [Phycisphaerales bacterium]